MLTNTHPTTGIRYGVISADSLDPDVFDELFYGPGAKDLTYEAALKELRNEVEREADDFEEDLMIAIAETDYGMLGNDRYVEQKIEDMWSGKGYEGREDYVDDMVDYRAGDLQIDEPEIEGEYEGVKYRISWLGGAPLVWIFESPHIGTFDLGSPCVPNACNLDCPNLDGFEGYTVPLDWLNLED